MPKLSSRERRKTGQVAQNTIFLEMQLQNWECQDRKGNLTDPIEGREGRREGGGEETSFQTDMAQACNPGTQEGGAGELRKPEACLTP